MSIKNRDRVSKGYIVDEVHRFNILLETREIFLHSHIDSEEEDPGVEYRMANNFIKNIKLLEHLGESPIIIHQHSIGGSWTEGMMIYDAIQTCPLPVVFITHGIAASMGTIIPQAADLIVTMPNCWWLIHDGYTEVSESQIIRQAKSWMEWEEKLSKQMMEIYIEVCQESSVFKGKSSQQIKNYIRKQLDKKEDWWLSAQEAVNYGFCQAIFSKDEGYLTIKDLISHVY